MLQSSGKNNQTEQVSKHIFSADVHAPGRTHIRLGAFALAICKG